MSCLWQLGAIGDMEDAPHSFQWNCLQMATVLHCQTMAEVMLKCRKWLPFKLPRKATDVVCTSCKLLGMAWQAQAVKCHKNGNKKKSPATNWQKYATNGHAKKGYQKMLIVGMPKNGFMELPPKQSPSKWAPFSLEKLPGWHGSHHLALVAFMVLALVPGFFMVLLLVSLVVPLASVLVASLVLTLVPTPWLGESYHLPPGKTMKQKHLADFIHLCIDWLLGIHDLIDLGYNCRW